MAKKPPSELSEVDRAAGEMAIAMAKEAESEVERRRIEEDLATKPWIEVAEACAYGCQCRNLRLKPWQSPPIWLVGVAPEDAADDHRGGRRAATLLARMSAAGVSYLHPNPLAALAAAEGK
jgi:hypothetical protein